MRRALSVWLLLAACSPQGSAPASDAGRDAGELRVVALAPHLAELMFAAGAGAQLVGVSSYTNQPAEARSLPVVGDAFRIDREQLALLNADLLLAWESGTPAHIVDSLRDGGYHVELIRTRSLADIGLALQRIGELTGRADAAGAAAAAFHARLAELADTWRQAESIRVFYQVSLRPLYTVNAEHYISELITLCGGQNIFGDLNALAPMITEESVLDRDPEVMLTADAGGESTGEQWRPWQNLAANRYRNHFRIPADTVARPTPRVYHAGEAICAALQRGRANRNAAR